MEAAPKRTSVALFVALTRAVRDATVPEDARYRAYDILDRMARAVSTPGFEAELKTLFACATQEPRFFGTLQPFWKELRALSASSLVRVKGEPKGSVIPASIQSKDCDTLR